MAQTIKFTNNAFGTLASGISAGATTITLDSGQGALFPAVTTASGNYFYATLINSSNQLEIVKCTNVSGDVLTVTRGQEGTTARAYTLGDRLEHRLTAGSIDESLDERVPRTGTTGAAVVPAGTTGQRPGSPVNGYFRYNATDGTFEGYSAGVWGPVGGAGATGGGSDGVFYENDQNVTADYTITSGKNAMSAGPITINTGVTVTVPSGSEWTVV